MQQYMIKALYYNITHLEKIDMGQLSGPLKRIKCIYTEAYIVPLTSAVKQHPPAIGYASCKWT